MIVGKVCSDKTGSTGQCSNLWDSRSDTGKAVTDLENSSPTTKLKQELKLAQG